MKTKFTINNLKSRYIDIVYQLHGERASSVRVVELGSGKTSDYKISDGGNRLICYETDSIGSVELELLHDHKVEVRIVSIYNRKNRLDFLNLSEWDCVDKESFDKNRLEVIESSKNLRPYLQWFVTWKCNYKCNYCWQEVTEEVYRSERHNTEKVEAWASAFNKINPIELYFTGGEPTLYKDITKLISMINEGINLSMTTNFAGSFRLDKWFDEVPVDRMGNVCASVHPTQIKDVNAFFDKVLRYTDHYGSERFQLEMVNHPMNTAIIPEQTLRDFCERHNIRLAIDQYTSVFDDEDPDQDGTDRALYDNIIRVENISNLDFPSLSSKAVHSEEPLPIISEESRLPVFCPAGSLRVNIDALGDAYTCMSAVDRSKLFGNYSLPHYKPLGNILDGTFERLNEPVICWEKFRCSACDYQRVGKYWRKMDDGFDKQLPICG